MLGGEGSLGVLGRGGASECGRAPSGSGALSSGGSGSGVSFRLTGSRAEGGRLSVTTTGVERRVVAGVVAAICTDWLRALSSTTLLPAATTAPPASALANQNSVPFASHTFATPPTA